MSDDTGLPSTSLRLMPQMRQRMQNAIRGVTTFLFPQGCLGCGEPVAEQGTVCTACWHGLHFIEEPMCAVSGAPFSHDFGRGSVSADVLANPPAFDRARSALVHTAIARKLVQRLKYGDRTDLAPWMAAWMHRAGKTLCEECDLIVPVPLHRRRYWLRRFNQSAELARHLSVLCGKPFEPQALSRIKATQHQVGLTADQRMRNVRGAFRVSPEQLITVSGRSVLLVDDVFTTGATIEAATRALRKAGAREVLVLTFSRVLADHASNLRPVFEFSAKTTI